MKSSTRTTLFLILMICWISGIFYSYGQSGINPKALTPAIDQNTSVHQGKNYTGNNVIHPDKKTPHTMLQFKNTQSVTSSLITIIESQSISGFHVMDSIWAALANSLGDSATIVPATTLDDTTFSLTTDILIISSGLTDLSSNRVNTVYKFLQLGKPVYIQGEFSCSFATNTAFADLVDSLGGSFEALGDSSGNLAPMNVLGPLSETPNQVDTLGFFWWGCYGSGDATVQPFLEFEGNYYGFIFTPPNHNYGIIITTTDQDWVLTSAEHENAPLLMANIISYLKEPVVGIDEPGNNIPVAFVLEQNYPNPFNPSTKIKYNLPKETKVLIKVYDILGNEIQTLINERQAAGFYEVEFNANNLASGIYFYTLLTHDYRQTKKMILLR